jgi:hypothetical protein
MSPLNTYFKREYETKGSYIYESAIPNQDLINLTDEELFELYQESTFEGLTDNLDYFLIYLSLKDYLKKKSSFVDKYPELFV